MSAGRLQIWIGAAAVTTACLTAGCGGSQIIDPEPRPAVPGVEILPRPDRPLSDRESGALMSEAHIAYMQWRYDTAEKLAGKALEIQSDNAEAQSIRDRARAQQRHVVWRSVNEADARAIDGERLKLREKLAWPGAIVQYPDKETWKDIQSRQAP